MSAFLSAGLLKSKDPARLDSRLLPLISHQYDLNKNRRPRRIQYTPGLFRRPETPVEGIISSVNEMYNKLFMASDYALQMITAAFSKRVGRLQNVAAIIVQLRSVNRHTECGSFVGVIAAVVMREPRDVAIASDMLFAPNDSLQALCDGLRRRHDMATTVIPLVIALRQQEGRIDEAFILALAAVVDMAE